MPIPAAFTRLAQAVPDDPAWVDVRGALLCGRSTIVSGPGDGFAVVTAHVPLVCVVGRPDPAVLLQALTEVGGRRDAVPVLAVEPATADLVARTLPGWRRGIVILHTRSGPLPDPPPGIVVRWSEPAAPLPASALEVASPVLRDEIVDAAAHQPVAYVAIGDQAVAFCHPAWRTERWCDISVETVARWQRRGFALTCARALIERMESEGLGAVWGAHEENAASLALAARLGFEEAARITVFQQAASASGGS